MLIALGSACIISIIRLHSLKTFGLTKDPTWDNVFPTVWSSAETCVALVCASLPAIWAALKRLFPTFFHSTNATPIQDSPGSPGKGSDGKEKSGGNGAGSRSESNKQRNKLRSFLHIDSALGVSVNKSVTDSSVSHTERGSHEEEVVSVPVCPSEKKGEDANSTEAHSSLRPNHQGSSINSRNELLTWRSGETDDGWID